MTEEQVRALVRDAVSRHLGTSVTDGPESRSCQNGSHDGHRQGPGAGALAKAAQNLPHDPHLGRALHIAHGRFVHLAPSEPDAPCIVEPQVKCHHCGFCQSYGH